MKTDRELEESRELFNVSWNFSLISMTIVLRLGSALFQQLSRLQIHSSLIIIILYRDVISKRAGRKSIRGRICMDTGQPFKVRKNVRRSRKDGLNPGIEMKYSRCTYYIITQFILINQSIDFINCIKNFKKHWPYVGKVFFLKTQLWITRIHFNSFSPWATLEKLIKYTRTTV